jgi:hypothetical protein
MRGIGEPLFETRLEVPILLVLNGNTLHRTQSLLPRAAATLQWPFFPSDLVAAITLLQAREEVAASMNDSFLNLDRSEIERQLRDDFEMALAAWAISPLEGREQARHQIDEAEKRLTDLIFEGKLPDDIYRFGVRRLSA